MYNEKGMLDLHQIKSSLFEVLAFRTLNAVTFSSFLDRGYLCFQIEMVKRGFAG